MCYVFSLTLYLFATGSPQSDHRGMIKKEICQALVKRKMEKAWLVEIFYHFQIFGAFRKLLKVPFSLFIKFSKLIVFFFCNSAVRRTKCRITFV